MKKCAFLTMDERGDYVIDDEHAIKPLAAFGWQVSTVSWRQMEISWGEFDAVIVRSTWEYWNDVPFFLEVLERINSKTRLANPLELLRWNLAKTYMRDLQATGINIVPTLWPDAVQQELFPDFFAQLDTDELVIKPVIGANGEDAYRVSRSDPPKRLARISRCFRNRGAMVQRFMSNILNEGEYSLFYFNGEFSHAILKVPAVSEFRSQEERGAEIRAIVPEETLILRGRQALTADSCPSLYARIDFVRDDAGDFALMEQEFIEPSLYLRMNPDAPGRFARAIDHWFS